MEQGLYINFGKQSMTFFYGFFSKLRMRVDYVIVP